jgi:hypothetical protein
VADNEIIFAGNAEQLVKELQKLIAAQKSLDESLAKTGKTAREVAREEARLKREAIKITEQTKTAQEKYTSSVARLDEMRKKGLITEEAFNRALRQEVTTLKAAEQAEREKSQGYIKRQQEIKQAVKEHQRTEEERGKATKRVLDEIRTPLEKYNLKQKELNELLRSGRLTIEQHGRAMAKNRDELRAASMQNDRYARTIRNIAGVIGITSGAGMLMKAYSVWINANRELIQQAGEVGAKYDEMFRKMRVQAGLTALETEEQQRKVLEVAEKTATPAAVATSAATQMVSAGFSMEEVTGGSLEAFLEILAASNIVGKDVDPRELVKSIASMLEANRMELNEENLRRVGMQTQRLFRGTQLELSALPELAGASAAISNLVTIEEQLAAMAGMLGPEVDASVASTALRLTTTRLAAARSSPGRISQLEELGLTPDDVDFVGESFVEVFTKLKDSIERLPPELQTSALVNLFGEKGQVGAAQIFATLPAIQRNLEIQKDTEGFAEDVRTATTGRSAAARRQELRSDRTLLEQDQMDDLIRRELQASARREGVSPAGVSMLTGRFDLYRNFGINPQSSLDMILSGNRQVQFRSQDILERVNETSGEQLLTPAEFGMTPARMIESRQMSGQMQGVGNLVEAIRENTRATKDDARAVRQAAPSPQQRNDRRNR